jgi:hypothetical protein
VNSFGEFLSLWANVTFLLLEYKYIFGLVYFDRKSYTSSSLTKSCFRIHFGRFFQINIWSPCCSPPTNNLQLIATSEAIRTNKVKKNCVLRCITKSGIFFDFCRLLGTFTEYWELSRIFGNSKNYFYCTKVFKMKKMSYQL